jgi:hypothetical protein
MELTGIGVDFEQFAIGLSLASFPKAAQFVLYFSILSVTSFWSKRSEISSVLMRILRLGL